MKYRKKPVIIEAEQYNIHSSHSQRGVCGYGGFCCWLLKPCKDLHVHTIHKDQIVTLEDGDWVIQNTDGMLSTKAGALNSDLITTL